MDGQLKVLLTNDDGIDSPGITTLYEALAESADVTVVAPADDQSAVGRSLSRSVTVEEHDTGFAIEGTPADCVITGIEALDQGPDVVVSGCNRGANLGTYVLGRSGTVSAAVEAAFFGIPAIAVSLYIPEDEWPKQTDPKDYLEAARVTRYLLHQGVESGIFDHADYLNVNVPTPDASDPEMRLTRPSTMYDMTVIPNGSAYELKDRTWSVMSVAEIDDPPGTDRRAVLSGEISVSPLTAPSVAASHEQFTSLAEGYTLFDSEETSIS